MSGCDCARCQTVGCTANELCPCCLKAEVEALRGRIEDTKAVIRVCGFTTSAVVEDGGVFGGLEVVPVANVIAALDGKA